MGAIHYDSMSYYILLDILKIKDLKTTNRGRKKQIHKI